MRNYLIKRLLLLPITLVGISAITFVIMRLAPGDPADMKVSPGVGGQQKSDRSVDRETYEKTRERFDLDKPIHMQYLRWLGRLMGVQVEVWSAKVECRREVKELLLARYRADEAPRIAARRTEMLGTVEQAVRAALRGDDPDARQRSLSGALPGSEAAALGPALTLATQGAADEAVAALQAPIAAEADRQLSDWVAGQAEASRFRYAEETNAIRQRYIKDYGKEFERTFRYAGLSLNRAKSGRWYPLDFGQAIKDDREVWEWLREKLPQSIELSMISIFLAYVISIPLGIHSAVHKGSTLDAIMTTVLFVLYSLPSFWVAIMLLLLFSEGGNWLHLFPVKGLFGDLPADASLFSKAWDHFRHLVLPVTCLTYGSFAYLSRQMRAGMLEVIRKDYIRTARAKGLSERVVIFKHALRNSLIPVITIVAVVLPALVGGSIILETIFTIDGIGKLSFSAIQTRDYPVLMAIFTLSGFLTLLGILLSDLLYAVVNPQISFEGR